MTAHWQDYLIDSPKVGGSDETLHSKRVTVMVIYFDFSTVLKKVTMKAPLTMKEKPKDQMMAHW